MSFLLVTTQGISNNFFKYSAEGYQTSRSEVPRIIEIQDNSENGIDISRPDVSKESEESSNQSMSDLPSGGSQGGSVQNNQTGNGLTGDTFSSEIGPASNETGSGVSGDSESSQTTNQTTDTQQTQTSNQDVNVQTNQTSNQDVNVQTNVDVEMKQKLDLKISEEEGEAPISIEEQNRIESQDKIVVTEHRAITGPDCRTGDALAGASNAEDLRVLLECQEATGTVMHTKNMDDGDYKFFLKLDPQFEFLVNDKNREETEGFLVVEIVPPDRNIQGVYLPQDGERVHLWGAWVTDKPKGWHEIHPTWKVVKL
ncbi:MAG TPA: hypothetical protein VFY55_02575 [Nitrososphaeraceae archaeon]|nr:hypothetical protein [Nitrososphaeraceae archaeon]